jgi:hypothetical protein
VAKNKRHGGWKIMDELIKEGAKITNADGAIIWQDIYKSEKKTTEYNDYYYYVDEDGNKIQVWYTNNTWLAFSPR